MNSAIPRRLDLTVEEADRIYRTSDEPYKMISAAFRLGFLRGKQAAERGKKAC